MLRSAANSRTFSRRSLHGQVAHEIGQRIVAGDLPPGCMLPTEEAASAELKVSRTAYREAMKVLSAKGLVESRPKIGTRVRGRDPRGTLSRSRGDARSRLPPALGRRSRLP